MAAYIPDVTRSNPITLAIAGLPERFTMADVMRVSDRKKNSVSPFTIQMVRLGMIEVVRIGQKGVKTFRKTEKYHPPEKLKSACESPGAETLKMKNAKNMEREKQAISSMAYLGNLMMGWNKPREAACA